MIQFEDYEKILEEKALLARGRVLQIMAEDFDSVAEMARHIGLKWMTLKRFLIGACKTEKGTLKKIDAYLDKKNK